MTPDKANATETLSVTDRLFNLAGYKSLSATSFVLSSNLDKTVFAMTESCKKIYISVYLNSYRMVGLLDTGSDASIIQLSCLEKLHVSKAWEEPTIKEITTFSGASIKILGQLAFLLKLSPTHKGITINVLIINDIRGVPKLLLGNDLLQQGLATIGYDGNPPPNHVPTVTFKHPEYFSPECFFKDSWEICECEGEYSIGPYEMGSAFLRLDKGAPVIRTDYVLITPLWIGDVVIVPSRSDLTWDSTLNCYVAIACILNLTNESRSNGIIKGKIEVVNQYNAIPLDEEITENLRKWVSQHPLGREILAISEDSRYISL